MKTRTGKNKLSLKSKSIPIVAAAEITATSIVSSEPSMTSAASTAATPSISAPVLVIATTATTSSPSLIVSITPATVITILLVASLLSHATSTITASIVVVVAVVIRSHLLETISGSLEPGRSPLRWRAVEVLIVHVVWRASETLVRGWALEILRIEVGRSLELRAHVVAGWPHVVAGWSHVIVVTTRRSHVAIVSGRPHVIITRRTHVVRWSKVAAIGPEIVIILHWWTEIAVVSLRWAEIGRRTREIHLLLLLLLHILLLRRWSGSERHGHRCGRRSRRSVDDAVAVTRAHAGRREIARRRCWLMLLWLLLLLLMKAHGSVTGHGSGGGSIGSTDGVVTGNRRTTDGRRRGTAHRWRRAASHGRRRTADIHWKRNTTDRRLRRVEALHK